MIYKKLCEDDILEIITEYYQTIENCPNARACLIGNNSDNIRAIIVLGKEDEDLNNYDLKEIDRKISFNGEHSYLENNPEICIKY